MPVARLAVRLAVLSCFAASASALGASPSPATAPGGVEDPIAALAAPDPRTRALAAETLGRSRDRDAVQPLIALLADPDLVVRKYAARSLGAIGDAAAAEPLIRALGSYGPEREAAAVALGQIGDRRAVAPLYVTFGDPEEGVRHAAAASLSSLGEPGASLLEQGLAGSRDAIAQLVAEDDGRLLARVLASFDKWHPASPRGGGVGRRRRQGRADDPLLRPRRVGPRVDDPHGGGVVHRPDQAGGRSRGAHPSPTDEFYGVREAAAWALGQSGDPAAVASLVRALGDPAPAVREAAAWGLKKTADPASPRRSRTRSTTATRRSASPPSTPSGSTARHRRGAPGLGPDDGHVARRAGGGGLVPLQHGHRGGGRSPSSGPSATSRPRCGWRPRRAWATWPTRAPRAP